MNRINTNNYEAYFLDYHEGSLDAEEMKAALAFLQDHPELYDEFEAYENVVLPIPNLQYPDKSELYKTNVSIPKADDWEYRCIAFMEGDMSDAELKEFDKQLKSDPEKANVLELYLSTRSIPDQNIQYQGKAELKKKVILFPRWIYGAVSAAAIIVLGWIIFTPLSVKLDEQIAATDTTREIIYLDKLVHPEKFEKIASIEFKKGTTRNSSLKAIGDNYLIEDDVMIRDSYVMAGLNSRAPIRVESNQHLIPPASFSFVYRYIPGAEDEEYQTLVAFTGDFIRKQLLGQDAELVKKSRFSLWELADVGLEKISNLFGSGADIEREYSESGELMAVSFESALVGFNKPVKRRSGAQTD